MGEQMKIFPIFPSILSTNFFNLKDKLTDFWNSGVTFIHLDIMDGHFVDNLSFGPSAITAIRSDFSFKFDSHLMVSNPGKIIKKFIEKDSDWISFHLEVKESIGDNIDLIKSAGKKVGLALNPDTPVELVFPYLQQIDYVLLMSVFPGYGGQKFIVKTIERVECLKTQIVQQEINCLIQVDGGVGKEVLGKLKTAGADLFVIGTSLYNSSAINKKLELFNRAIKGEY
jgi:ribulose-phosphate 3-epimerase